MSDKPLDAIGVPLCSLTGKHDFKLCQESDSKRLLTPAELQALTPERGERRVADKLREARNLVQPIVTDAGHPYSTVSDSTENQAIRLIIDVLEERGK